MSSGAANSDGIDPPFLRVIESRVRATFEAAQKETLYELDQCMPTSVVDSFTRRKRTRKVCLGDLRVSAIRKLLETGFGVTRSTMQQEFHESFLAATSRHLYSEDADVNWSEVKARQGWNDTRAVGKLDVFCVFFNFASLSHIVARCPFFYSTMSDAQAFRENVVGG